jgi:hypothetical protein
MKRFGSGEFQGWIRFYHIAPLSKRDRWTVVGRTRQVREIWATNPSWRTNYQWLSSLVYFASNGGGDEYAWDHQCRFYLLPRLEEDKPVEAGDSFWGFVEWAETDIRSWRDSALLEDEGPGMYFAPTRLRAKKRPLKRDVKRWLECNNGNVRDLARSIRDERRADTFPVLADALEEAGCTNADLLSSCRSGDPDLDGAWVLLILLGNR